MEVRCRSGRPGSSLLPGERLRVLGLGLRGFGWEGWGFRGLGLRI